jgi:CheY-like chemotaxis protein
VKKILLADDSITIQKVVELTFSEGDYQVICVSNGAQALKRIDEVRPDVVLLDVIMPEKNGYEVCEQIKRSPSTSGIPVLLLTGTFEPFDKKRAETAGANGHLTKPFESQTLVSKVEELIASRPSVVSREEAGEMEVISGGDVYHVGGARADQGMRPIMPSAASGLPHAAPPGGSAFAAPEPVGDAPPPSPPPVEFSEDDAAASHPTLAAPDAGSGGSYLGFADLGVDVADEPEIVPDRYDDSSPAASTSTVRLRRDSLASGSGPGARETRPFAAGEGPDSLPESAMEGMTGGFELQDARPKAPAGPAPGAPGTRSGRDEEVSWTPPPEAPPAETWQSPDEEPMRAGPSSAAPAFGNGTALTPEAIDLIAERVVQRLSDRVVREIAWEVIPQVAEAIVRRRIKELEEKDPG